MDRISIKLVEDRITVAGILIKNGYTVRQGSEQIKGKKSYDYYLEFELSDPKAGEKVKNEDQG